MKAKILKTITYIAAVLNMTSICCLDSEGVALRVVLLVWLISGLWLMLFAWANNWFGSTDGKW